MAVFSYKAIDVDTTELSGTIVADTPMQARDQLRDRGLKVAKISETASGSAAGRIGLFRRGGSGTRREVVAFVRELSTLLQAGIPLLNALKTLEKQHKGHFRTVIQDIGDQVAGGVSLAEAIAKHDNYFDGLCTSIAEVGENTGSLDSALEKLADFKEKAHRLKSRVTTALMYPAVVCIIGVAVCVFLMTYVVPNLLDTLIQSGKPLPGVTHMVKSISDFLINWWWVLLVSLAGMAFSFRVVVSTEKGGFLFDRLILKIPVLGELIQKENTSRISVVLSALIGSGLEFVEAVRITRRILSNRVFRKALRDYESAIIAGGDISGPLEATGVFRPMVVQMLAVGQQTGQVEKMLLQLSETYDREVATATQRLTSILEPMLIVILAIMIGFIAFATILPIVEVSNVL